ncbi:hypothetical protein TanjilG_29453 [Lupinus angustifolius]|uniref:Plastid movement impaired protein n=1 Tax=Lupinus angustifolius TaxID=3871 RepID=A0A4P1R5E4_LUPAN|nr:PREDICTED: uncharacterized protein At1g66480-like [Lupinus angustifolius]OIW02677.1 hypothetical protein TanjilG_29453 [Lupinus angustifolius]
MGNSIGRSRKAKVMKIDGETFKVKTPAIANDVVKDHPGHVLLDSQAVKYFGLRAKPLEPHQELKPKKIYFLVELPKIQAEDDDDNKGTLHRRVRSSGISRMNAKERLDLLMLSKRSVSDFGVVREPPLNNMGVDHGPMRVKMRIPKAQLEKMMEESNDGAEVAEKIMSLYLGTNGDGAAVEDGGVNVAHQLNSKRRGKRVSFSPMEDSGEIHVEAASQ